MNIYESVIGAIGGTGLAMTLAYVFWVKIRAKWLAIEILELHADLRKRVKAINGLEDHAYGHISGGLLSVARVPEHVSFPFIAFLIHEATKRVSGGSPETPRSDDPEIQKLLDEATGRFVGVLANHVTHRTLSGGIIWLLLKPVGKRIAKSEVKEAVQISTRLLFNRHYAGCAGS